MAVARKLLSHGDVFRFGLVGIGATALYAGIFWFVSSKTGAAPAAAAVTASVISIAASYLGHYYFTFRCTKNHYRSAINFLAVSAVLVAANAIVAEIVSRFISFEPAPLIATCVFYPLASFLLNRTMVFGGGAP